MRVPYSWLTEYCDPGIPANELAERLSMTGTEVERVTVLGAPSTEGFVVGRVLSVERHPNADRLSVCEVDTGEMRTIVCGATNVAAGQTVPVALPGAVLPGGQQLGRAKLRGVVSDGMILSETELEIGDDAEGIVVLGEIDDDRLPAPGDPLSEVLPVADPVLELEVTPNRPDCLGVYGVAREVHAITGADLAPAPWEVDAEPAGEGEVGDYASVEVEVPDLCPRFTARVFTGVEMGPSPLWMKARLIAAGQRPISNVVDVTNYVMLLTAQPLHAFDLDQVVGGALIVRRAREGEKLVTLDGVERVFDTETVLVCDREGPSGIAGIMGGARSEVSEATTRVLLEVATWNGPNILRTSSLLSVRSEASTRFEKQLHPDLAIRAQGVASRLMVETFGARLVPGTADAVTEVPAPQVISLHGARVEGLLGMDIEASSQCAYLERLGFGVDDAGGDGLAVSVPADRHYDVTREADVIEEVARVHGLDEHLPSTLPAEREGAGGLSRDQAMRRRAEDVLRDLGFLEVVTWSFLAPRLVERLRMVDPGARAAVVAIQNPLSEEHSVMRTTLLGGLLDTAAYNAARGAERVELFESGRVYLPTPPTADGGPLAGHFAGKLAPPVAEPHRLACLALGSIAPPSWRGASPAPAGFHELKGVFEVLCEELGVQFAISPAAQPFLHPARAGRIEIDGQPVGWLGELHPLVAREWELSGGAAFEVDLAPLLDAAAWGREQFEDLTRNPAVYQDIAVTVGEDVPAERVREAVHAGGGEILRAVSPFDVYRGEQVGPGRKSLALRLEFRAPDRTLTDEEVARRRELIREALAEIGGALRE